VLVTKDRGRKNREMLELLRNTLVSVLQTPDRMPPREFARHFVRRYDQLQREAEERIARGGSYRSRLTVQGRLERLTSRNS
jgi:hypothetical protein